MTFAVFLLGLIIGLWLSGVAASKVMDRSNSRSLAVLSGCVIAPLGLVAGVFAAGLFISARDLQTGGIMALGLIAIYGVVFAAIAGAIIAAFVGIGAKQSVDTVWSSEDGDRRGYRSAEDDQRYG